MELLYFAWVRERIGLDGETVTPPAGVATVAELIAWLAGRSPGHAAALADPACLRAAVDQRFAGPGDAIAGAREVAIFRPVTGVSPPLVDVRVQRARFDVAHELARLEALGGGGVASFTGIVRGDGGLTELMLEHHPGMTDAMLADIAGEALRRWPLLGLVLIHRVGGLAPGEPIVLTATAARHRAAALEACAFLIDWAKTRAPFWKRERFADGTTRWVEARGEDEAAAARWGGG